MKVMELQRVEVIEKNGGVEYRSVEGSKDNFFMGSIYTLGITPMNDNEARVHGWNTGYPQAYDEGPNGYCYSPSGLKKESIVYVSLDDFLLSACLDRAKSAEEFRKSLDEAALNHKINMMSGVTLVGKILDIY